MTFILEFVLTYILLKLDERIYSKTNHVLFDKNVVSNKMILTAFIVPHFDQRGGLSTTFTSEFCQWNLFHVTDKICLPVYMYIFFHHCRNSSTSSVHNCFRFIKLSFSV